MSIVDLLFPKYCVGCKKEGNYICQDCAKGVRVRGVTLVYEGIVRSAIKEVKFRGSYDMVRELVDLWERKTGGIKTNKDVVVTAVPMWSSKKKVRGFNLAELIARELAKRWGVDYQELLVRTRETKSMYGLNRQERKDNIDGAFVIKGQAKDCKNVILVDDVWTTGSTLSECEKELKRGGIKQVIRVVLAS